MPVVRKPTFNRLTALARSAALFLLLLLVAARALAAGLGLAWDPVTNASGYMVYYGPAAGNYPTKINVGNTTTHTLTTLVEGSTYHFAITAYDGSLVESGFSNDVAGTVPYSAPAAQFTASATLGVAPLALNFLNASTGAITSYAWTFGDGTTSTAANPSKVYSAAGTYTVSLTVTGPGGSDTQTRTNYITVTALPLAPVAQFTGTPTSGLAPLTVNFTNTSTGNIASYAWTFGDGTTSTAANPVKVYSAAGSYTVSLTVTGPGGSNTQTRTNYITVTTVGAPVAQFTGTPTSGVAPRTVNFTNTSTGNITSYAWTFGDGTTSTAANPVKVYSAAGSYTVSLTVTGPGGSNTQTRTNYITVTTVGAPVAQFTGTPTSGMAPRTVNFTNTSTGSITSYAWTFGDGTTSTAANPVKVYSAAGSYTVSLTVTGPGGSNTQTRTNYITVTTSGAPAAQFTANRTWGSGRLKVAFTNTSTGNITSYAWNFGDGTTSTAANPAKVYSTAGTYSVSLTVTGLGGSNTQIRSNYITVEQPYFNGGKKPKFVLEAAEEQHRERALAHQQEERDAGADAARDGGNGSQRHRRSALDR